MFMGEIMSHIELVSKKYQCKVTERYCCSHPVALAVYSRSPAAIEAINRLSAGLNDVVVN